MAEKKKNPTVFLDISTGYNAPAERIVIELFSDVVPETAENFRSLCVGAKSKSTGKQLCYKGSKFHRIVKGFMAQGGDVCNGDGSGCESIYGGVFRDEGFKLLHDRRGLLSMANCGQNTNGCQFFITFNAAKHLNGIHVVFGEVLEGMESLNRIEHAGSEDGKPTCPVTIVECGEVHSKAHEAVITEKERRKIRKSGKASHPNDSSDEEGRGRHKKSLKDKKKKRKRRYSSSDSCTSDDEEGRGRHKKSLKDKKKKRKRRYSSSDSCTSDNSGSDSFSSSCSDSDSDSDSSSSDASCRKKEMSKRARHTRGRKRRDVRKEKQRVRHNKKSKHKSKWSSESSSGSEWQ